MGVSILGVLLVSHQSREAEHAPHFPPGSSKLQADVPVFVASMFFGRSRFLCSRGISRKQSDKVVMVERESHLGIIGIHNNFLQAILGRFGRLLKGGLTNVGSLSEVFRARSREVTPCGSLAWVGHGFPGPMPSLALPGVIGILYRLSLPEFVSFHFCRDEPPSRCPRFFLLASIWVGSGVQTLAKRRQI